MSKINSRRKGKQNADSLEPYFEDIKSLQNYAVYNNAPNYVPLLIPSISFSTYLRCLLESLFFTLLFDWTMPIVHPLNFLLMYFICPLGAFFIFLFDIFLRLINRYDIIDISPRPVKEWAKLTERNLDDIVRSGTMVLGNPFESYVDENNGDGGIFKQIRNFNIDMVETLLFLSSIVYERKEDIVNDVIMQFKEIENKHEKPTEQDIQNFKKLLHEAEEPIRNQANKWELEFTSLSELNSIGGPYAGMFWNRKKNFIVVAFKGTTPTFFSEWLIDFMIQRIDARASLYGEVHEGFYTSLFPKDDRTSSKLYRRSPSMRIIEAIRAKVAEFKNFDENTDPVSIYITGHSLGGALATLLYTRLLKTPKILGEHCILRDGFTFAAPIVGNNEFASQFSSRFNEQFEPTATLWRVVADDDIVPHVAPSNKYPRLQRYITTVNFLNYVHVGEEINFYMNGSRPSSTRPIFSNEGYFYAESKFNLNQSAKVDSDQPLYPIEKFLPSPIRNHLSHRYFIALEKARNYFED